MNRQSSLNDAQAHVDGDGKFRAVISQRDPGVPNWLDKADYPWGIIQMRLNRANEYPDPTIKKVPLADVREHLPADTPVVTPRSAQEQLRRRRKARSCDASGEPTRGSDRPIDEGRHRRVLRSSGIHDVVHESSLPCRDMA